ncbi:MAG TPA: c-type cytochrome [Burkholderiaceae bacterium]|nr:c-type cytochrome [Burkholderiaceae bacterium]
MVLAIVLVILVLGSVLFHFLSPWYYLPLASNWSVVDDISHTTIVVTGAFFVVVTLFMAYCVVRFRHREGSQAAYEPESKKLEIWLSILTAVGIAALLAPGLVAWAKIVDIPKDAQVVEAYGRQWNWMFRFPGKDGVLGATDARFVSDTNPFGIDPNDPNGQDDVLVSSSDLHLPIGVARKVELRSLDVLHDFSVPQFRIKMDLVPGLVTRYWFTPTAAGTFDLNCQELCGVGHFTMHGQIVVEDDAAFQSWLNGWPTFAQTLAHPAGDAAAGASLYAVCSACHGQQAEGNPALHAPKLSGQADWYLVRQLKDFKAGARGADEHDVNGHTMAPMAATLADDDAIANVVAYIKTLPDQPAQSTVTANLDHGRSLYANCSMCHGDEGHGIHATNAPRLAGMSDWYLATQLDNFRHGYRGRNLKDPYGPQMSSMAAMLTGEHDEVDLAGYVNSLR